MEEPGAGAAGSCTDEKAGQFTRICERALLSAAGRQAYSHTVSEITAEGSAGFTELRVDCPALCLVWEAYPK